MAAQVKFLDTTLRDGEQSAGIGMTVEEKLQIARQLARLKVDIIEAGFAASSPGDFQAVQRIAQEVNGPVICSLSRAVAGDVDAAWNAIQNAAQPRIHVFSVILGNSPDAPVAEGPGRRDDYGGGHGRTGQVLLRRR